MEDNKVNYVEMKASAVVDLSLLLKNKLDRLKVSKDTKKGSENNKQECTN